MPGVQNKEVSGQTSSPRTTQNVDQSTAIGKAGDPYDKLSRVSLGRITAIHQGDAKVKVRLAGEKNDFARGSWLPVTQSIENIYLLYGQMRTGMVVRVYWVGKSPEEGKRGYVEIIGDETADILKQLMPDNYINTSAYQFTGGGLTAPV